LLPFTAVSTCQAKCGSNYSVKVCSLDLIQSFPL